MTKLLQMSSLRLSPNRRYLHTSYRSLFKNLKYVLFASLFLFLNACYLKNNKNYSDIKDCCQMEFFIVDAMGFPQNFDKLINSSIGFVNLEKYAGP